MSVEAIMEKVNSYPARHVVITGGEPALQITTELVMALKQSGHFVQIETNGSIELDAAVDANIDWITCSPKGMPVLLTRVDELKVVFESLNQDLSKYEEMARKFGAVQCLQPCDWGNEHLNRATLQGAIIYVKSHPDWSLSLQIHKLLNIR